MTLCDRFRIELGAHVYGDLDAAERAPLEEHLRGCAGCREELRGLQRASLRLGADVMFPREADVDWNAFARATVQRATGFRAAPGRRPGRAGLLAWWGLLSRRPAWAGLTAGLLIVIGAAAGTFGVLTLQGPAPLPVVEGAPAAPVVTRLPGSMLANIEATSAKAGTRRYLSESRALLVSLLGTSIHCERDTVDIKDERAKTLELIRRQRFIADSLETLPLARAQDVCRDLERLFLEIAALDDCARAEQIRELRDLVERRQLLLRLDLVNDEMQRRETIGA